MPGDRSPHDRLIGAGATGNDQAQRRVSAARLRERLDQPRDILARLDSRLHGQDIRLGKGRRLWHLIPWPPLHRRARERGSAVAVGVEGCSLIHDTNTGRIGAHLAHQVALRSLGDGDDPICPLDSPGNLRVVAQRVGAVRSGVEEEGEIMHRDHRARTTGPRRHVVGAMQQVQAARRQLQRQCIALAPVVRRGPRGQATPAARRQCARTVLAMVDRYQVSKRRRRRERRQRVSQRRDVARNATAIVRQQPRVEAQA